MDKPIYLIDIVNENSIDFGLYFDTYFRQQTDKNQYHNDFINSIIKILKEIFYLPSKSKKLVVDKIKYKTGNFQLSNDFDTFLSTAPLSYEQISSYFNDKLKIDDVTTLSNHSDQRVIINNIIVLLKNHILKWKESGPKNQNLDNRKLQPPIQLKSGRLQSIDADISDSVIDGTDIAGGSSLESFISSTTESSSDRLRDFPQSKIPDETTSTTNLTKDESKVLKTKPSSTKKTENGIMIWVQVVIGIMSVIGLVGLLVIFLEIKNFRGVVLNNSNIITEQIGQLYTPKIGNSNDYGYLKTQFEKLIKPEVSLSKIIEPSLPKITGPDIPVSPESKKGTLSIDEIAPTLKANLDDLDKKIKALKQISEKVEVKLDDAKIIKIFDSVVKDETSDFGLAMKKIKDLGNKGPVKVDDTASAKDKGTIDTLKQEKGSLQNKINAFEKDLKVEKESVNKLNGEVDKKNKEIDKLEAKIKSIGDEKTGFKGPAGHFAILLTNSTDFQLPSSLLETVFGVLEKQNVISKDVQKLGMYIATGEDISTRYDLITKIKPKNPTATEPLTGRPTECIIEVGKSFLKYAFDNGKESALPIADRKAIIIATLSAKAPKLDSDGWDKITQVDAILIQTPKDKDFREASDWLDFTHKKNGRLVFVQGFDKFAAGSPSLLQLEKHLLTLLNTKKE